MARGAEATIITTVYTTLDLCLVYFFSHYLAHIGTIIYEEFTTITICSTIDYGYLIFHYHTLFDFVTISCIMRIWPRFVVPHVSWHLYQAFTGQGPLPYQAFQR